jgi:hypothetical protein
MNSKAPAAAPSHAAAMQQKLAAGLSDDADGVQTCASAFAIQASGLD